MTTQPSTSLTPPPAPRGEAGAAASTQYRVHAGVVAEDAAKAVAIWRESNFGATSLNDANARYDWFYRDNPQGEGQINFLAHAGETQPVGSLGVGLREWFVRGQRMAAGVLVDFVVHSKHRTAAPALMLQRQSRERASQGAQILYGLPDTKAVAIFKRLGSQFECKLQRFARVLRSNVYLRRLLPRWLALPLAVFTDALDLWGTHLQLLFSRNRGAWTEGFDDRFDDLWQRVQKQDRCIGLRDQKFLTWRFTKQPAHNYRVFVVTRRGTESLRMYFVCELVDETLSVKDCINAGSEAELRHGLLMLSLAGRKLGAAVLSIQVSGDPALLKSLRRTQFLERDSRPFFAMVAPQSRDQTAGVSWYITPADEDV